MPMERKSRLRLRWWPSDFNGGGAGAGAGEWRPPTPEQEEAEPENNSEEEDEEVAAAGADTTTLAASMTQHHQLFKFIIPLLSIHLFIRSFIQPVSQSVGH